MNGNVKYSSFIMKTVHSEKKLYKEGEKYVHVINEQNMSTMQ